MIIKLKITIYYLQQQIDIMIVSNLNIIMLTNRQHIDFFKLFKILDLKKIQKQGDVKLVQDKALARKVLSIQGNVSTQNYIVFDSTDLIKKQPMLSFAQRYLYLVTWMDLGKAFTFQIILNLNGKTYKALYSSVFKAEKLTSNSILQLPLQMKSGKWTIIVIDLYDVCEKFGNSEEIRLSIQLKAVEVRAHSKLKNLYLSDNLYDPSCMPKDMQLPLRNGQDFFIKYGYIVLGCGKQQNEQLKMKNGEIQKQIIEKKKLLVQSSQKQKNQKQTLPFSTTTQTISKQCIGNQSKARIKIKEKKISQEPNFSYQFGQIQDDLQQKQLFTRYQVPKPRATIDAKLAAFEGKSIFSQGVTGLEGFITYPSIFAVHKPIKCMSVHKKNPFRLAVGYIDGSICIWDLIRQKSIVYLKTQLNELKQIALSGQGEEEKILLVGKDKMKRENILIINQQEVLFKQISTFSIEGFIVCEKKNNEEVIVSYGYQNIRLWKMNENNHIITGTSLYLGKMNQKISYRSACLLNKSTVLVGDSSGYLTKVSLENEKMEEMRKISENGIDIVVHIPEIKSILVTQTSGCIKVLSYELQVLQQFDLGNRIKNCSVNIANKQVVLCMQHYNCSLSTFNIENSEYSFLSRQHTQQITMLKYHSRMFKIVSISKDNTIRIWSLGSCNRKKNLMEYQIKQEYEFLISNGQQICCLATDGKSHSYIGFSDAMVRKINIEKYEIIEQKSFAFQSPLSSCKIFTESIQVSKNSKNLLISFLQRENGRTKNGYVVLSDESLNIIYKFNPPFQYSQDQSMKVLAGFSETHKKFYLSWSFNSVNRLQVYSLTGDVSKIERQLYLQSVPASIRMVNQFLHVSTRSAQRSKKQINFYEIYSECSGDLIQVHQIQSISFSTSFPLVVSQNGKDQVQIEIINGGVRQTIDMPEKVQNIEISQFLDQNEGRGFILCSGARSNAIYMIQYESRNLDFSSLSLMGSKEHLEGLGRKNHEMGNRQMDNSQEELECVQNELIAFQEEGGKIQSGGRVDWKKDELGQTRKDGNKKNNIERQGPKLISLYAEEEELFQKCQNIICPAKDSQEQQLQSYNLKSLDLSQGSKGVELMYGWNQSYSPFTTKFSHLIWDPSSQSALFLSYRTLILHYFTTPIHQKMVRLPAHPSNIFMIGCKYIGVLIGNQVKIYTKQLQYIKALTSIGQIINSACLSTCEGYLIILSSSPKNRKSYIQISDFVTESILCSTYLEILTNPQIIVNPYQQCLQFILISSTTLYFYRVTSILTLQTQQLQKLQDILNSTDVGNIISAKFIHLQQEQILLIGMQNGSLIIVDSRSNSILMLCKNVCSHQIQSIEYEHHDANIILVFITQSNLIFKYKLDYDSLQSLISALNNKPNQLLTVDSQILMCSQLKHVNGNTLGMLLMTKFGVLWLLDIVENDTIKVLTVHVQNRNQGQLSVINKALFLNQQQNIRIITASGDGSVKQTSIDTLQQSIQIFKPRRKAHDVITANGLVVVAFGMEVCFYKIQEGEKLKSVVGNNEQWVFLGSVNLLQYHVENQKGVLKYKDNLKIIGVRNIPFSDNYVVCTSEKLFMLYHLKVLSFQTKKLKMEIKQICGGFDSAQSLDILGYNYIMVREPGKINVWIRKQKRGQNPIEQLSKVQQLAYYMMDVNQVEAKDCRFIMTLREKNRRQYILCMRNSPIIQWRDFQQHCIIKEVQIGVSIPKTIRIDMNGNYLVGDQQGVVWSIKQNGLTLNKVKVFDTSIGGIEEIGNGKLLVYGPTLAIVTI